jgi:hypothetical protein
LGAGPGRGSAAIARGPGAVAAAAATGAAAAAAAPAVPVVVRRPSSNISGFAEMKEDEANTPLVKSEDQKAEGMFCLFFLSGSVVAFVCVFVCVFVASFFCLFFLFVFCLFFNCFVLPICIFAESIAKLYQATLDKAALQDLTPLAKLDFIYNAGILLTNCSGGTCNVIEILSCANILYVYILYIIARQGQGWSHHRGVFGVAYPR